MTVSISGRLRSAVHALALIASPIVFDGCFVEGSDAPVQPSNTGVPPESGALDASSAPDASVSDALNTEPDVSQPEDSATGDAEPDVAVESTDGLTDAQETGPDVSEPRDSATGEAEPDVAVESTDGLIDAPEAGPDASDPRDGNTDEVGNDTGTDATTTGPRSEVCSAPIEFVNAYPRFDNGASEPSCALDENGRVVLEYAAAPCTQSVPYRGCEFAWHRDMTSFHPADGGRGVYEVFFCVEGAIDGALNLWYEGECGGCDYNRRFMPLLEVDEPVHGCRRMYFAPDDVDRHRPWATVSTCANTEAGPNECKTATDAGFNLSESGAPDAGLVSESGAPDAGPVSESGAPDAGPFVNYGNSKLVIINEWCTPNDGGLPTPTGTIRITLQSVVYHPESCLCSANQRCQTGELCQQIAWPQGACRECSGLSGICR
jgi:hypothetical protein